MLLRVLYTDPHRGCRGQKVFCVEHYCTYHDDIVYMFPGVVYVIKPPTIYFLFFKRIDRSTYIDRSIDLHVERV